MNDLSTALQQGYADILEDHQIGPKQAQEVHHQIVKDLLGPTFYDKYLAEAQSRPQSS